MMTDSIWSAPGYRAAAGASETGLAGEGDAEAGEEPATVAGPDGEDESGEEGSGESVGVATADRWAAGALRTAYQEPTPVTAAARTTMSAATGSVSGPPRAVRPGA